MRADEPERNIAVSGRQAWRQFCSDFHRINLFWGAHMNRVLLKFAITVLSGSLLFSIPTSAQFVPPAKKALRVRITQGPEIESANNDFTIIRWTSNNPGGSPEHFAVVHYGTDKNLSQTAKSHIRLNQTHRYTVFRVRMTDLKPRTTYYYRVDSANADGTSDGVVSSVKTFTTP
jgi:phosphodiesterase/alkaline phosphatase D-like protein